MVSTSNLISTGIYVVRRRQLIEMLERCAEEERYDLVKDIFIRYRNLKRIYGYKISSYWSNIATVESYYRTNMDFLNPETGNISSTIIRASTPRSTTFRRRSTIPATR